MLLSTHELSAGYGRVVVLRDVSIMVDTPEIVAVLGRNGAGKTTLMKTLCGLVPAQKGHIQFQDTDTTRMAVDRRARMGLGYVPQGRGIFPKLSVRENLLVGLYAVSGAADTLDEILGEFPALQPRINHRAGQLSGGQQQILALARALMIQPRLLLLDEPSEGIQPSILEEIADILARLRKTRGLSILVVEQNIDFVRAIADRAYIMDIGTVTRRLSREQLVEDGEWLGSLISGADTTEPAA